MPWLYVVDGRNPEADVMIFSYSHHCLLNVEHDAEGIGSWCRWHWPSAEVAFFEGMWGSHLCIVPEIIMMTQCRKFHAHHMALTRRRLYAERDPQDPEYPRLKLIGVYPVRNGWARINLKEMAGKGTDHNFPLYVMQRKPLYTVLQSSVDFAEQFQ